MQSSGYFLEQRLPNTSCHLPSYVAHELCMAFTFFEDWKKKKSKEEKYPMTCGYMKSTFQCLKLKFSWDTALPLPLPLPSVCAAFPACSRLSSYNRLHGAQGLEYLPSSP